MSPRPPDPRPDGGPAGPGGSEAAEADLRASYRVQGVVPDRVILATRRDELVEALAMASREGWAVEPAGLGGWLGRGRPPARLDAVLSVAALGGVESEPGDLTVSVGAGTRLSAVQESLSGAGQWLALDGPGAWEGTVGALVATGTAGPLRLAHGTPRDQVLGVELVTGDGRALAVGGRVVKNVAGYDVTRVLVGSMGTLGVLTRIHLRVHPRPEADASWSVSAESRDEAERMVLAYRSARLPLAALEVLSPAAAARVGAGGGWALLARALGPAEMVAAAGAGLGGPGEKPEAVDGPAVWHALSELEAGAAVVVRLAGLPAGLGGTLAAGSRLLESGLGVAPGSGLLAAHAGDGIVRAMVDAAPSSAGDWSGAVGEARARLCRGTVVVAQAPPALASAVDGWGDAGEGRRLMSRLKEVFDPAGVLAPGRFVV